jgi:hypothetical protein
MHSSIKKLYTSHMLIWEKKKKKKNKEEGTRDKFINSIGINFCT